MNEWGYTRPEWARRINAMAGGLDAAAIVPLDPDDLVAQARRTTGLVDLGADEWREPLERLVASLEEEAGLNVVGRLMSRHDLVRHLSTRLLLVEGRRQDPSIECEQVTAPLFITGPARSGTSILHELLAEDPAMRAPYAWEMAHPTGDPTAARAWAESEFDLWSDVHPDFAAVHQLEAGLPEECLWLMAPDLDFGFWSACTRIPSFLMWRATQEQTPRYAYHRSFLQQLQRGGDRRRWVLKSPVHLGRLPALFAVYPDARVILTHRDPVKTLTSSASTLAAGRWVRSDSVDPMEIGAGSIFGAGMLLNRLAEQAPALPKGQVAHLLYPRLLSDPVGAIEAAYGTLGLEFDASMPTRIEGYLANRPQTKFGVHRYTAEMFGIDIEQIRRDLTPYTDTFGISPEGA